MATIIARQVSTGRAECPGDDVVILQSRWPRHIRIRHGQWGIAVPVAARWRSRRLQIAVVQPCTADDSTSVHLHRQWDDIRKLHHRRRLGSDVAAGVYASDTSFGFDPLGRHQQRDNATTGAIPRFVAALA